MVVSAGEPLRWQLTDGPEPVIGPADLLVRVVAAGLNRADLLMRRGDYVPDSADWRVPTDRVGFEMAGHVVAVGAQVRGVDVGQPVMAQTGGACAELVAVDHRSVLPVPDADDLVRAAGLPSGLLTEFDALRQAGMRAGDHVLITGGSSGVGLIGVQLARAAGAASVVATTRSPDKAALLRSAGATRVVVTTGEPVREAELPAPPDVVLDHLGGAGLADVLARCAPRARIVQIGRLAGARATLDLEVLAGRRLSLLGTTFRGRGAEELFALVAELRAHLAGPHGSGLHAIVDSTFGFDDAERAAARLAEPDSCGKVVLRHDGARP